MPTSAARKRWRRIAARLAQERDRLGQVAIGRQVRVRPAEIRLDLILGDMDRRRDDMARRLVAKLDDVFAEIGLDRLDGVCREMVVEADLLGDHRLALGDGLRPDAPADGEDRVARFRRGLGVVDHPAGGAHLVLIGLEVEVEMGERVILDVAPAVAQLLELGECVNRCKPLGDETGACVT